MALLYILLSTLLCLVALGVWHLLLIEKHFSEGIIKQNNINMSFQRTLAVLEGIASKDKEF